MKNILYKPVFREDGKILKGPGFFKPDLTPIVNKENL